MKKDSTFLALELLHFTKSEAKAIKKSLKNIEDIHLYEKDERLFLYPVIQEVIDVLANVESEKLRLQFVWLDVSTGQVKDSDLSNKVIEFEEANIESSLLPSSMNGSIEEGAVPPLPSSTNVASSASTTSGFLSKKYIIGSKSK